MGTECMCLDCMNYRAQLYRRDHPEKCVIEYATSKEVLDNVWIAIKEGIGKEQEGFTFKQLMGEKIIATKQPKKA